MGRARGWSARAVAGPKGSCHPRLVDPAPKARITEEMYLAMERLSDVKHELHDGQLWAMAGASARHNGLVVACSAQLYSGLRGQPCTPLASDQRVHIPATGEYCYPDLTVVCGEAEFHAKDRDSLVNPTLIVEVLSKSTARYDRGAKFDGYRAIPSFSEYVLVWQEAVRVEVRFRESPRRWSLEEFGAGEVVPLRSIDAQLDVDALYEGMLALQGG